MVAAVPNHATNGSTHAATTPYDVESVRQHFPALRGKRIPLNNASGSVMYEGAVKA